jgi:hypothetical protein
MCCKTCKILKELRYVCDIQMLQTDAHINALHAAGAVIRNTIYTYIIIIEYISY